MDILLAQTAAGFPYDEMLAATAPLHRAFCAANAIGYEQFFGVRRGYHPWQASFNRIIRLHELATAGFHGWFLHLDADAVIRDPAFPIRAFLAERRDMALIAAAGGPEPWNINNGVFFLNLGDARGRRIVEGWRHAFHATIDDALLRRATDPWQPLPDGRNFPDDQHLLQMLLLREPDLCAGLVRVEPGLMNYHDGRFIAQFLRTAGPAAARLASIRAEVAAASARLPDQGRPSSSQSWNGSP